MRDARAAAMRAVIRTEIVARVAARGAGKTVCPSEVARAVAPDAWRALMALVRDEARELAREGAIVVTQRGTVLPPDAEWRGAIRLGSSRSR